MMLKGALRLRELWCQCACKTQMKWVAPYLCYLAVMVAGQWDFVDRWAKVGEMEDAVCSSDVDVEQMRLNK